MDFEGTPESNHFDAVHLQVVRHAVGSCPELLLWRFDASKEADEPVPFCDGSSARDEQGEWVITSCPNDPDWIVVAPSPIGAATFYFCEAHMVETIIKADERFVEAPT